MTLTLKPPSTVGTVDPSDARSLRSLGTAGTAWGACDIRLKADREASLSTGSTHKVYRGWRFAAVMQHGHPQPGTTVFTVPVDPAHLATSGTRYALAQLENQGIVAVGEAAAFSWATTSIGAADPFAAAQARAQRRLEGTGWTQDAEVPTQYAKPDPTLPVGDETAMPSPEFAGQPAASFGTTDPGLPGSTHLLTATSPAQVAGLDGWETDGGASSPGLDRGPADEPGANR